MRYVVILLLCCIACVQPSPERQPVPLADDSTFLTGTFYLVRHEEPADSGIHRAGALYHTLKDSGIEKIYITPSAASRQTAESLFINLHIDTVAYKPDSTGEGLLYEITRRDDWGKRVLVIGQGNTLLPVMRSLRAKPPIDSIGKSDYSNLFIVYKNRDSVRCRRIRY